MGEARKGGVLLRHKTAEIANRKKSCSSAARKKPFGTHECCVLSHFSRRGIADRATYCTRRVKSAPPVVSLLKTRLGFRPSPMRRHRHVGRKVAECEAPGTHDRGRIDGGVHRKTARAGAASALFDTVLRYIGAFFVLLEILADDFLFFVGQIRFDHDHVIGQQRQN